MQRYEVNGQTFVIFANSVISYGGVDYPVAVTQAHSMLIAWPPCLHDTGCGAGVTARHACLPFVHARPLPVATISMYHGRSALKVFQRRTACADIVLLYPCCSGCHEQSQKAGRRPGSCRTRQLHQFQLPNSPTMMQYNRRWHYLCPSSKIDESPCTSTHQPHADMPGLTWVS